MCNIIALTDFLLEASMGHSRRQQNSTTEQVILQPMTTQKINMLTEIIGKIQFEQINVRSILLILSETI